MVRRILFILTLVFGLVALGLYALRARQQAARSAEPAFQILGAPVERAGQATAPDGSFAKFSQVPEFSLMNRSGSLVTLADLKGKVWLANFVYTTCPTTCPMVTSRFSKLHKEMAQQSKFADLRFVSFSVDPENDSPLILQGYAVGWGASDAWLFLTGERQQLVDVATKGFLLGFEKSPIANDPNGPVNHSTKIALVDKEGVVRRFYEGVGEDEGAKIVADVQRLLE